jgi:hypothetical protein
MQGHFPQPVVARWLAEPLRVHVTGQRHMPAVSRPPRRMLKASQVVTDRAAVTFGLADVQENGMCSDRIQLRNACATSIASPAGRTLRGRRGDQGGKKDEGL